MSSEIFSTNWIKIKLGNIFAIHTASNIQSAMGDAGALGCCLQRKGTKVRRLWVRKVHRFSMGIDNWKAHRFFSGQVGGRSTDFSRVELQGGRLTDFSSKAMHVLAGNAWE